MCGDIEKNPVPYHFVSVLLASFSENHGPFWTTLGIQYSRFSKKQNTLRLLSCADLHKINRCRKFANLSYIFDKYFWFFQ